MIEPSVTHQEVDNFTLNLQSALWYCDAKCMDAGDLKKHSTTYHGLELVNDEFERELFQCDICPLFYKKLIDLEFHERGCHWDHLWPEEWLKHEICYRFRGWGGYIDELIQWLIYIYYE